MEGPYSYHCIVSPSEGLYKEKGSKFLAFAYPVSDVEEIKTLIAEAKKKYFDARHHTYAYILGYKQETFRSNDDGEPSGTAGRPIYGQILSYNLTQVLIIVVRYFGGTKLGTSGLIKAYKTAAASALEAASIVEIPILIPVKLRCSYEKLSFVMKALKDAEASEIRPETGLDCIVCASIKKSSWSNLSKLLSENGVDIQ